VRSDAHDRIALDVEGTRVAAEHHHGQRRFLDVSGLAEQRVLDDQREKLAEARRALKGLAAKDSREFLAHHRRLARGRTGVRTPEPDSPS